MNFFFRNPVFCLKNPRYARETVKAMAEYKADHPVCEYTGRKPIHVHHVVSIRFAPERAADKTNMISLAAKHIHLSVGHAGDTKQYVDNVQEICAIARVMKGSK